MNLVGTREPSVYGTKSFDNYFRELAEEFSDTTLEYYQSNVEGELINKLQEVGFTYDGIVLNAGGYSHTSVAITDAIAAIETPVIEVHISNIHAREEFRHESLLSKNCAGVITGLGLDSYRLAIVYLIMKV